MFWTPCYYDYDIVVYFLKLRLCVLILLQAEEAQRLRKRRKAEKRLLDMQRRQKERIEEVRETQKKVAIMSLIYIVTAC